MARGPTQQAGTENSLGSQQLGQANKLETGTLIPEYTSMLSQGYTPGQENAMTTAGMGGVSSSYDAAAQQARDDAARTNNPASLSAQEDELAQQRGVAEGNEAAGLQTKFANDQQKQQEEALQGLQGLYNTNAKTGEGMYGLANEMYKVPKGPGLFDVWSTAANDAAKLASAGAAGG